jgi:hypothetical protein
MAAERRILSPNVEMQRSVGIEGVSDRSTAESTVAFLSLLILSVLIWGWRHRSGSVDMALHYALVDFVAEHWRWPTVAVPYMGEMNQYPPVSHTVAAIVGSLCGSLMLGLHLVSTACALIVLAILFTLLRFRTARATFAATAAVTAILAGFEFTHAFLSREIVENFFYPQVFGEACVFAIVWLRSLVRLQLAAEIVVAIAATFILGWVYPIAAVQLGCIALIWRALQMFSTWHRSRQLSVRDVIAFAALAIGTVAAIVLHPRFSVVLGLAANDGWIAIRIPGVLVVPAAVLLLLLAIALGFAYARRSLGLLAGDAFIALCGGIAVASLAQSIAFYAFGIGVPYAVYKHMFAVLTLMICAAVVYFIHITRSGGSASPDAKDARLAHLVFAPATLITMLANDVPWHGEWLRPMMRAEAFYRTTLALRPDVVGHAVVLAGSKIEQFGYSMGVFHLSKESTLALIYVGRTTAEQRHAIVTDTPVTYALVRTDEVRDPACVIASDATATLAMIRFGCQIPGAGDSPK